MSSDNRHLLREGATRLGLAMSEAQEDLLINYLALLIKWNKTYNLISRKETDNLVARHLLDSLVVLPYINGFRIVDVGSGGGLPGIPLAIMRPDCQFVLLDCNSKKARFRTQAVIELGLKNVEVVDVRAEEYQPQEKFDTVISRAFATIADMLSVAGHLAAPQGQYLAMKGVSPDDELAALPAGYELKALHELNAPFLGAQRHLAILARAS